MAHGAQEGRFGAAGALGHVAGIGQHLLGGLAFGDVAGDGHKAHVARIAHRADTHFQMARAAVMGRQRKFSAVFAALAQGDREGFRQVAGLLRVAAQKLRHAHADELVRGDAQQAAAGGGGEQHRAVNRMSGDEVAGIVGDHAVTRLFGVRGILGALIGFLGAQRQGAGIDDGAQDRDHADEEGVEPRQMRRRQGRGQRHPDQQRKGDGGVGCGDDRTAAAGRQRRFERHQRQPEDGR